MTRWLRASEHTLSADVPSLPDRVREFYVDLDNLALVHPLVVDVRTVGHENTTDGYVRTYRVTDRIQLGRLTLRTRHTARVHVRHDGVVLTEARQFPMVRLSGVVTFDEIGAGTRLVERIRIHAPWFLASVTVREAVAAHTAMLSNIRRQFR